MASLHARLAQLRHRAQRARQIPIHEVPHRLAEQVRRQTGRWVRPFLPDSLAEAPPPSWLVPFDAVAGSVDGPVDQALRTSCEQLLEHGFSLMGAFVPVEHRAAYRRDPWTGATWDDGYCFDVPFLATGRDVRVLWEVQRLGHLPILALFARLHDDDAAATACMNDIAAFVEQCPPYRGLGWASGIEVACRAVSVLLAFALLGERFPMDLRRETWRLLHNSGVWLARYPSTDDAANNHRVAEIGGLLLLATLGEHLPDAAAWRAEALASLPSVWAQQVYPDGVGTEQSPTYQAFSMEWALLMRLCDPDHVGPVVDPLLRAGAYFLASLCGDAIAPPPIGDDDEGRVLRATTEREPAYASSIAGLTAAIVGGVRPALWTRDLRWALFGGPAPAAEYRPSDEHFPVGGYTVNHREIDGRRWHLVFDHGPLGLPSLGAHGHADALAIWLSIDGEPAITEAGTYSYNADERARHHYRSAAAHSTLVLEGEEPSLQAGPFTWSRRARCTFTGAVEAPAATHDGYARRGLTVSRELAWHPDGLLVNDAVVGGGPQPLSYWWLGTGIAVDGAVETLTRQASRAYGHQELRGVLLARGSVMLRAGAM